MSDQADAETSTLQHTTLATDRHPSTALAGFESAIPASQRPKTHALDGAATGIGNLYFVECRIPDTTLIPKQGVLPTTQFVMLLFHLATKCEYTDTMFFE